MGYDTLDVYPHVYLDWLQEETARWRAQMEEAVMRKSPSVAGSYTSVEAFVPRRRKTSKDKDYLSPCWSLSSSKHKDCEIATSKDMDCLPRGLSQSSLVAVFQQGQGLRDSDQQGHGLSATWTVSVLAGRCLPARTRTAR